MVNILIVDDEGLERMFLKQTLERQFSHECCFFMAQNGKEAVKKVKEENISLIFMDIEMPGMNGIEATKEIKRITPACKVVFITAYGEFQYAKEAISLGVEDYLLKPVADVDILHVCSKLYADIEEAKRVNYVAASVFEREKNFTEYTQGQFVRFLMCSDVQEKEIEEYLAIANVTFQQGAFAIFRCEEEVDFTKEMVGAIEKAVSQDKVKIFSLLQGRYGYIFIVSGKKDLAEVMLVRMCDYGKKEIELEYDEKISVGIGSIVTNIDQCRQSFGEAQRCIGQMNMKRQGKETYAVLHICDVDAEPVCARGMMELENTVCKEILDGNEIQARATGEILLNNLLQVTVENEALLGKLHEVFFIINRKLYEACDTDFSQKYKLYSYFQGCDPNELKQQALYLISTLVWEISLLVTDKSGQVMREMERFIKGNYMRDISLESMAMDLNYSVFYSSKLFKQYFGKNFKDYLIEFKIEKAKELLRNPAISVKDVGAKVGYSVPNYFAKVFRKVTGKTPTEYRNNLF